MVLLCLFGLCALPKGASADIIQRSYQGTFTTDDEIHTFSFVLATTSRVYVQSLGYGGGTNIGGTAISSGGFASALWLFNSGGNLIADDNAGGTVGNCGRRQGDPSAFPSNACFDAYIPLSAGAGAGVNLLPGSYTVDLTQQGNDLNGTTLSSGFSQAGQGNYTGGPFIDPFGNQRDGHFAVDIVGVDAPEPATLPTILLSLVVLGFVYKRFSPSSQNS